MKFPKKAIFISLNVMVALMLVTVIAFLILQHMESYTRHGEAIMVPPFEKMSPAEAEKLAQEKQLRTMVVDSLYDDKSAPGTILEQYPTPGSLVKSNRLIRLIINAHSPEKIMVPNLKNSAYRQTIQTLETKGFKIGRIEYVPSEFKNLVLDLKWNDEVIEPGTLLTKGSTIDMVLGKGPTSNKVRIPQFLGKTLTEAIFFIRRNYLNIEEIVADGSVAGDKNTAIIYQQTPEFDEEVEAGTPVKLFITRKQELILSLDSLLSAEINRIEDGRDR